jgi:hypothetical protein
MEREAAIMKFVSVISKFKVSSNALIIPNYHCIKQMKQNLNTELQVT